jgi:porin
MMRCRQTWTVRNSAKLAGLAIAGVFGLGLAGMNTARAEGSDGGTTPTAAAPDFFTGLFSASRSTLLGDIFGLRTFLGRYGVTFNLSETSEVLGNVSGGVRRGFDYEGLTTMSLGLDTSKALGWEGGTFNASALQIHGRNLSAENLNNLQTASGIEANRATRLWELWYQQSFLDGLADVKIGQQSIDQEFISSQYSALYVNTMMGWPMIPSADLYAGGPAYPLSSPGIRLRAQPIHSTTALLGVFDDNPPGGPFSDDSQLRGHEESGSRFNMNTGALIIGEVQYALNQPSLGDMAGPDDQAGLPGTYKLGIWYDTAKFPDQRYDTNGVFLANTAATNGNPRMRSGNYSLYGVVDQMIWQPDPQGPQSIGVFARPMAAPGDRNAIEFSVNAGINLKAPLPGRDNDTFGIGYGMANISDAAVAKDQDTAVLGGAPYPIRSREQFVEVTYQYQMAQWWQIQPDAQYVFNPGGGIQNPNNTALKIKDEAILGVRTNITF